MNYLKIINYLNDKKLLFKKILQDHFHHNILLLKEKIQ